MGAIVGILDPLRAAAGEPLRARLRPSFSGETPTWMQERGALALGCGGGVERGETADAVCLFEGQLYNREELARQLAVPADLEPPTLVLRGYGQLGPELWPLLRGDFVIVVWDREAGTGAVVRDQLGGRALYLRRVDGVVAFATELTNLVELLPSRPPPDDVAVAHWLLPSVIPEERTLFAGIEEVPPATCLALGRDGARARRYWAPRFEQQRGLSLSEASAQARELLTRAVERRKRAGSCSAAASTPPASPGSPAAAWPTSGARDAPTPPSSPAIPRSTRGR
jgi:asparagine synthetase B (glutamine-hydrolysing)